MKAAAMFAAAYGFPPSACRDWEEVIGLMANMKQTLAVRSAIFARGIAACLSAEANASIMEDCGAPAKDVIAMKMDALKQKAGIRR
jgi:hypothetical protein